MASCSSLEILTRGEVRTFLQVPDPKSCARKTIYYGKDCQYVEVSGVTRTIKNAGTPIRTWNRRRKTYCRIGTTETPPDNPQLTLRFYEACGRGLPLPHILGECRIRVINNYGLCRSSGSLVNGWSSYVEVLDVNILSEGRGDRSSFSGADDALVDELTVELINIFDVSIIQFGQVDLTSSLCIGTGATPKFNSAIFGCQTGCGSRRCNCVQSCDDGSYSFYVGTSCGTPASSQSVLWSTDGGDTIDLMVLPAPVLATQTATDFPQVAIVGSQLYAMAYQNPPSLYVIDLDSNNNPTGSWQLVAHLNTDITAGVTFATGIPAQLITDGDYLHILVSDTTNGSRYYTLGGNISPTTGARYKFTTAQGMSQLAVCGDQLVVGGLDGSLSLSNDGGTTWNSLAIDVDIWGTAPETEDVTTLRIVDSRIWVGTNEGNTYYTGDEGDTWVRQTILTSGGVIKDIHFSGDDIGWIADTMGRPISTWVGGIQADEWTRNTDRVYGWPSTGTILPISFATPDCASATIAANTLLVVAQDAAGVSSLWIGRSPTTGI